MSLKQMSKKELRQEVKRLQQDLGALTGQLADSILLGASILQENQELQADLDLADLFLTVVNIYDADGNTITVEEALGTILDAVDEVEDPVVPLIKEADPELERLLAEEDEIERANAQWPTDTVNYGF